ncbi:MAG: hypothetical protein AAF196_19980 [Planctomycetota bacterium]
MSERFFRDIANNGIRRGAIPSVSHLNDAIDSYIEQHNLEPTLFSWAASARDILAKVTRARSASGVMAHLSDARH